MNHNSKNFNSVFYAETYHPIQAGSIDGTDIHPHDNAVYRALLCSNSGLYDPFGDPKVIGDPYCTIFVGRLSHFTTEETLRQAMNKYGSVKNLRLVRHIVTGASRGYAFVEFETEREMHRAYMDAHKTFIDDAEIMVDYNRQQLMPGWIPRRLGGGLGGKKESGQLRFGGRERPFRAPLRQIPYDDLKRLGIPAPPEGRYMSRFEVPSPPRRRRSMEGEDYRRHGKEGRGSYEVERSPSRHQKSSRDRPEGSSKRHESSRHSQHGKRSRSHDLSSEERHESSRHSGRRKRSHNHPDHASEDLSSMDRGSYEVERSPSRHQKSSGDRPEGSSKRHESSRHSQHGKRSHSHDLSSEERHESSRHSGRRKRSHNNPDHGSEDLSSMDRGGSHRHGRYSHESDRWSPKRNSTPDD